MKINEAVMRMRPPRYTAQMAAPLVGRDVDTLKRWKRNGVFNASDSGTFGQLTVDLYTDEDIAAMKQLARTRKAGRKPSTFGRETGNAAEGTKAKPSRKGSGRAAERKTPGGVRGRAKSG